MLTYALISSNKLFNPNIFMALPISSTIHTSSFIDMYKQFPGNVVNRNGDSVDLDSIDDPMQPFTYFAFGLGTDLIP